MISSLGAVNEAGLTLTPLEIELTSIETWSEAELAKVVVGLVGSSEPVTHA